MSQKLDRQQDALSAVAIKHSVKPLFFLVLRKIFPFTKTQVTIAMIYKTTLIMASLKSMYSETATKFEKIQCFDVYLVNVKTLWVISDNLYFGKCNCHRLGFFKPMK